MKRRVRYRHYFRRAIGGEAVRRFSAAACDPARTLARLSTSPQPSLSWFSRLIAVVTTPFKRIGIQGWQETGCDGAGGGTAVRDAQHSTDGFWTIDVELSSFSIGASAAELVPKRFLRLEVEPGTPAHAVCAATPIPARAALAFGGAIVVDLDADFLEIHPEDRFAVQRMSGDPA